MKKLILHRIKKLAVTAFMVGIIGTGTVYADNTGISIANRVNIRNSPSASAQLLGQVNKNDGLVVKEKVGNWYQIEYQGADAWIYADFVSFVDQEVNKQELAETNNAVEETNAQEVSMGEHIVAYAKKFIGVPYRWGGTDLNRGVDCSGFTQSVMKHFGIHINRVSHDQVYNGVYVEKTKLQPGDLVFFDTYGVNNGAISHVGIYVGDGRFIQASTGRGVMISSLNEGYYQRTYVKGVRVIEE